MATEEPQAMPASRINAEDSSGGKGAGFLPKPFAIRDCPPGMRIRGGRPMQSLRETDPKSTVKGTDSEEKRGSPSRRAKIARKKKAGVVPTKVSKEDDTELN